MKKAYINANIYKSNLDAIVVEDNYITKVASSKEVLEDKEHEEIVDLKGMSVLPGFIDSHMHLLELGFYLSCVQLANCTSLEDMKEKLSTRLSTLKEGEWLIARGYNEEHFTTNQTQPTKEFLDSISKDVPICVTRSCGHSMSCNTKALELSNINNSKDGIVEEEVINVVHDAWPNPTPSQLMEYIYKGIECANQYGVTTVGSDDFISVTQDYKQVLDVFEKLSYQEKLNIRINEQCEFPSIEDFSKFLDDGYTFDVGNDYFRIGPLKLIADGSLGARSAAMTKGYHDDPNNMGILNYSKDELKEWVELANKFNMPTITHCIGDKAVDEVLDAYDGLVYDGNPLHHGLVHCQILRKDQIQKIIESKLSCYFQSLFIDSDASILEDRVGKELAQTSYPFKTLFENTIASNGSDAPVEMPNALYGIELAVTRVGMNQNESLTIEEAIDSYTEAGAKQLFMEDKIGKIQEGYYADFVVLDTDITNCDPSKIHEAKIMMTIMDGNEVYTR